MKDALFNILSIWQIYAFVLLIIIVSPLWEFLGKWILNKKIRIRRVIWDRTAMKTIPGQLNIVGNIIAVGFLWSSRKFEEDDIVLVAGYSTEDFASETWDEFLVVMFADKSEIKVEVKLDKRVIEWIKLYLGKRGVAFNLKEIGYGTFDKLKVFYKVNKL